MHVMSNKYIPSTTVVSAGCRTRVGVNDQQLSTNGINVMILWLIYNDMSFLVTT